MMSFYDVLTDSLDHLPVNSCSEVLSLFKAWEFLLFKVIIKEDT